MEMDKIRKVICVLEKSAIDFAGAHRWKLHVSGEAGT